MKKILFGIMAFLASAAFLTGCSVYEPVTVGKEVDSGEIECVVKDVDTVDSTETDASYYMSYGSGGGGVIIGGNDTPVVKYYVYLADKDGKVMQFETNSDVFIAMKQMINESVTINYSEKEMVNTPYNKFFWQGKELKNPVKIDGEYEKQQVGNETAAEKAQISVNKKADAEDGFEDIKSTADTQAEDKFLTHFGVLMLMVVVISFITIAILCL